MSASTEPSALDVIRARHSVREYRDQSIDPDTLAALQAVVDECARESGVDIQVVTDNPEAFQLVARFGLVRGATVHIAFVTDGNAQDEAVGYWGQRIVLAAQRLGLNTCWVAFIARKKSRARVPAGKKLRIGIAVGYGKTQGAPRKTKSVEELGIVEGDTAPAWFATAMEAAQLAPTAMNNQHFLITLRSDGRTVNARATKQGAWDTVDLGIVKRNFEEAANAVGADWHWE